MTSLRPRIWRAAAVGVALTSLAGSAIACGDDDNEEEEAEVQAAYDQLQATTSGEEGRALLTDDFVENAFGGLLTAEELFEDFDAPALQDPEVSVDGDTATIDGVEVNEDLEGQSNGSRWTFKKVDDAWLLDDIEPHDADGPDDATEVSVGLEDFSFDFDEDDFEAGEALVINAENEGDQAHHIILVLVDEGVNLEEALEEDEPEGVTSVIESGLFLPGDEGTVFTTQPLQQGNYVMLCFLPDTENPDGPPHFQQGMLAEFTVN